MLLTLVRRTLRIIPGYNTLSKLLRLAFAVFAKPSSLGPDKLSLHCFDATRSCELLDLAQDIVIRFQSHARREQSSLCDECPHYLAPAGLRRTPAPALGEGVDQHEAAAAFVVEVGLARRGHADVLVPDFDEYG